MLVLSRRPGERILIGNDIVVTVVRFQGGTVRLGIEAPREFAVIREELSNGHPGHVEIVMETPVAIDKHVDDSLAADVARAVGPVDRKRGRHQAPRPDGDATTPSDLPPTTSVAPAGHQDTADHPVSAGQARPTKTRTTSRFGMENSATNPQVDRRKK